MFTAHILEPATSFKVSTCRCSGSWGRLEEIKKKTKTERHTARGADRQEGEKERDEAGELGKHGSHYGSDLSVSVMIHMCAKGLSYFASPCIML